MNSGRILVLLLSLSAVAVSHADDLRRNPFSRPDLEVVAEARENSVTAQSSEPIRVNAILLDGADSLVSVNGTVIGIGEEHDGYTLQSVQEDSVIFVRRGNIMTVELFEERSERDAR